MKVRKIHEGANFIVTCSLMLQPAIEASMEDDTTESDTCSTDANRKRPMLDSSEESESVDIPRIKTHCFDAENTASD